MIDGKPTHPFESTAPRSRRPRIAVVGAGVSGLTCARGLAASGLEVTVIDKARGAGGRSSTRRGDGIAFDHGAQYFTARDPGFVRQVTAWERDGVVRPWVDEIVSLGRGEVTPRASDPDAAGAMVERTSPQFSARLVELVDLLGHVLSAPRHRGEALDVAVAL